MSRRSLPPLLAAALALLPLAACDGPTDPGETGFVTAQPAQAVGLGGAEVTPILSVGDTLPGTDQVWAPLPDGLGAYAQGGRLVVLSAHELSAGGLTTRDGRTVFPYARVARLVLDPRSASVLSGSYLLDGSEGYQRFCSATFATAAEGMPGGWFLVGEESAETGKDGLQVAVSRTGAVVEMPWMGRFRHENTVPVPGFPGKVVLVGMDDSPGEGELYLYVADDEGEVLAGGGRLHVFAAAAPAHVGSLAEGDVVTGRFVEVPGAAALSSVQLQAAVDALGAFRFVHLEDGDYDRRSGLAAPTFYLVDSGGDAAPSTGGPPWDPFGSIYRLELDARDPTAAPRLTLLLRSAGPAAGWASPDNVGTSRRALMVQEDPTHRAFARAPRIWSFPLTSAGLGAPRAVAELANPDCEVPRGTCWESSGIVDVSRWLGEGAWLFDVQAHALPVPSLDLGREGGQLLLLRAPGS